MSQQNTYFEGESDGTLEHPRLRRWSELVRSGAPGNVEVRREKGSLGFGPPVLYVTFERRGDQIQDREDWTEQLNRGLVALRVRAINPDNEAVRFALALGSAFEPAEDRFGEGFFNSVLIEELRRGPFGRRLAGLLAEVHVLNVDSSRPQYDECRALILEGVRGRAHELLRLSYPRDVAESVLATALGLYVDERFSVSTRRSLGFR